MRINRKAIAGLLCGASVGIVGIDLFVMGKCASAQAAEPAATQVATTQAAPQSVATEAAAPEAAATQAVTQPADEPATAPTAAASAPKPPPPKVFAPPMAVASAAEQPARTALAERLTEMAKIVLTEKTIEASLLRENAALLEAAVRESPMDFRFHRLLIESYLQLGDHESAAHALENYLDAMKKVNQTDQVAQVKLIDLYVLSRESADDRIRYLQPIVAADGVPAEVRSHAAMQLAGVYAERGQDQQAADAVDNAINLSPLNAIALRTKFARIHDTCTDAERVGLLLLMLRANPSQSDLMAEIANELTDNAMIDDALWWYRKSIDIAGRLGVGQSLPDHLQYAAALLVGSQPRDAAAEAARIMAADPSNADAAIVNLLAAKRLNDSRDSVVAAQTQAETALQLMLNNVHNIATTANKTPPATMPTDAVLEAAHADAQNLKEWNNTNLINAAVAGLIKYAWYEIYFAAKPAAAVKAIDALRVLLPEDDVNLARLDGWSFLIANKPDEARVKLSAVADRDPISRLGMIRLDEANDKAAAAAVLAKLCGENAGGVQGAILVEALRDRGGRLEPGAGATAVKSETDKFKRGFLDILDRPSDFYKLKADPLKVGHSFGEPILTQVTIQNVSDFDLTLGDDGVIRPDLWFDARLLGLAQQSFSGVQYDRMGQQLVLKARSVGQFGGAASQTVRLDSGPLSLLIDSSPQVAISMLFSLFTNPVAASTNSIGPGPAGYRVQLSRQVERVASPIGAGGVIAMATPLRNGSAVDRIRTADLMAAQHSLADAQLRQLQQAPPTKDASGNAVPAPDPKTVADQTQFIQGLMQGMHDEMERASNGSEQSQAARGYLNYIMAVYIDTPARRADKIDAMVKASDWDERLLGLVAASRKLDPEAAKKVAEGLANNDADVTVKQFATAMVDWLNSPAATQPSTQPTDAASAALPEMNK